MEDVRLGRKIGVSEDNINVLNASLLVVQDSPKRVLLIFYPPLAGTINITIRSPAVATAGFQLLPTSHPLELNIKDHGQLVSKAWYAISDAAGGRNLCIHQGELPVE